jgi:glycosyltransferase involved in cell wall biosynthesis
MDILHVHWGFILGGGARYVQSIAQLSATRGIHSHVLCILDPSWPTDHEGLSQLRHTQILIRGRFDRSWIGAVANHVSCRRPALVMTHGFNAHFVAWAAQRRLERRLPVVCSYHGPYHPVNMRTRFLGLAYDAFTGYFLRQHAHAVVTVASHAKAGLVRQGVPARKITVIHNAVQDTAPSAPRAAMRAMWRQRWGVGEGEILIGAVGRLDRVKGQAHLIEAFSAVTSRHPRARLVIVGDGPDRGGLEAQARRILCPDRVILTGSISRAEEVLPALDIYALPSLSECHSIGLLEAMRAGLPIVATAVGGNPESITDGQEGLLVPSADPPGLAAALQSLMGDQAMSGRLGSGARARYLREFTEETMLRKTAAWLMECAAQARGRLLVSAGLSEV